MKIKILIIIIGIYLLTGCTASYTMEITEDTFDESITIEAYTNDIYDKNSLYTLFKEEYPVYIDQEFMYYDPNNKNENYSYYTKTYQELSDGYLFNYRYTYGLKDISRARAINMVYKTVSIGYIDEEDFYYISLKEPIIFINNNEITSISINLIFEDAIIIENNADNINGSTYTWNLNPTELKDINIKYRFENEEINPIPTPEEPEENEENNTQEENVSNWANENKILVYVGAFSILVILILIVGIIKFKKL